MRELHVLECLQEPLAVVYGLAMGPGKPPYGPSEEGQPPRLEEALLTPREIEVLSLVSQGMLARTVASKLGVSPRTVHRHLGNIYRKLDAHDRLVAVRRAEHLGLLRTPAELA